ncbi:LysR family transcriptional regulator [Amycolatopsis sp. FDAARGOS 1241]|uniref:LysR family transcriptional regulator n=1 Tax=Amycolatopsis sp. FDAARGOS 1241 TaxID=2778070 RepID=UPI001EF350E2|nr:LysR family transcriptional regulator [Amycolatopsis sp. FDAARGOS 1241]
MSRRTTHLAGLDLNLLVVLRELLRERNVTRAAERVGVSQPALSAALARLRRHFEDELLVRAGRGYVLTPLARQLVRQVEDVCAAAEQLFATGSSFAPGTSVREFTLLMADYTLAVIGQPLAELFEREAPRARLRIRLVRESLSADLPRIVRFVDGVIAPPIELEELPRLRSAELFRDEWVCVLWAGHEIGDAGLTLTDLQRLDWVVPYHREPGVALPPVSRRLAALGLAPRVAMSVESYQAVPALVAGTHRIALVQRRLAVELAKRFDLKVLECPGEPEGIVESLWWHEDLDPDPAHAWLREALRGLGERLRDHNLD